MLRRSGLSPSVARMGGPDGPDAIGAAPSLSRGRPQEELRLQVCDVMTAPIRLVSDDIAPEICFVILQSSENKYVFTCSRELAMRLATILQIDEAFL